ncbi:MAG: universal stress protein [Gammaproteobacteria bacterium]|nr:universal stress protein [Gammaproteobacteria bacterium]
MTVLKKIFVVIDPTTDNQTALASAMQIASRSETVTLHVYEAVYSSGTNTDVDALQRVELARHRAWVESLVEPIRAQGKQVEVEIEWTSDWREALVPAAKRAAADLVVKAASERSGSRRRMLKKSDWTLLRNSLCPVYLIKNDVLQDGAKVLVALDIAREDELHSKLNERVIQFGQAFAKAIPDSALHAVNAYADSDNFVYQPDLADKVGIERTDAHTIEGVPEKVIPDVAEEIDAGIVIIGTASRDGLKGAVIGNTVEKILDAIHTNILTVTAQ